MITLAVWDKKDTPVVRKLFLWKATCQFFFFFFNVFKPGKQPATSETISEITKFIGTEKLSNI